MMWFKKHLAVIIIIAASIAASACVIYMVKCDMTRSRIIIDMSTQALNFNAKIHENNEIKVAEKLNIDKEAAHAACEQNVDLEIKKIQKISLPKDLLKNAVWSVDESFRSTVVDVDSREALHATFTYDGKTGYAYYQNGGMFDENPTFGIVEYDGKKILADVYIENAYHSSLSANGSVYRISEQLGALACYLPNPINYYYSTDIIVADPKWDQYTKVLNGEGNNFNAAFMYVQMPVEIYGPVMTIASKLKNNLTLYTNQDRGYYVVLSNGKRAYYSIAAPRAMTTAVVDKKNISVADYSPIKEGGCGFKQVHIATGTIADYREAGKASNGDKLYLYSNDEPVKEMYGRIYYPDPATGENITYDKFKSEIPYFIWFDQVGTPIVFSQTKYQLGAECGKPVIYLYPEKDMNVSVKVEPNGGFKKTEPAYDNGWNVWATTKSELTNLSDNTKYSYLFWEGKAYNYETPEQGFVLKRENVNRDMKILLARLGLNEKESADFMEFWQPKLEVKPYVYVTFVSQEVFDKLAPLTVTPKPDKVIRVFMDYTPMDNYAYVAPLKITTPVRNGFTVVEWGGRLR